MTSHRFHRAKVSTFFTIAVAAAICLLALLAITSEARQSAQSRDAAVPWTSQQTIEPAALAKQLSRRGPRPVVICVGFRTLYEGAHVPGASFHGPAMDAKGLADLKKFAQPLPRSTDLVVYCGCCPLAHCPNIRPAFEALRAMGFTHLRVLVLPHDFAHDWVEVGYPVAKGTTSGDRAGHPANGIVGSIPAEDGRRPARIRVASDVQRANLIHEVYPIYPQTGNRRMSGTVRLHVLIAADGTVRKIRYMSGPQWLATSAINAVRQWRYRPTLLNGKPVEVDTTISVVYKLGG